MSKHTPEITEQDRNYIEHLAQQIEQDHDTVYHGAKHAAETTILRERDRYAWQSSPVSVDINQDLVNALHEIADIPYSLAAIKLIAKAALSKASSPKQDDKKIPWGFCVTKDSTCTMNYCDDNGCIDRKPKHDESDGPPKQSGE